MQAILLSPIAAPPNGTKAQNPETPTEETVTFGDVFVEGNAEIVAIEDEAQLPLPNEAELLETDPVEDETDDPAVAQDIPDDVVSFVPDGPLPILKQAEEPTKAVETTTHTALPQEALLTLQGSNAADKKAVPAPAESQIRTKVDGTAAPIPNEAQAKPVKPEIVTQNVPVPDDPIKTATPTTNALPTKVETVPVVTADNARPDLPKGVRESRQANVLAQENTLPPTRAVEKSVTPTTFQLQQAPVENHPQRFSLVWPAEQTSRHQTIAADQGHTAVRIRAANPVPQTVPQIPLGPEFTNSAFVDPEIAVDVDGLSLPEAGRNRMDGSLPAPNTMPIVHTRAEIPSGIARQIADMMQRAPDRAIELALSPAELGSVRMKMTPAEMGMVVSIFAERPETLELMRRNIESLEQAIANLGYEDVAFSFDTSGGQSASSDQGDPEQPLLEAEAEQAIIKKSEPAMTVAQHVIESGLDVRI